MFNRNRNKALYSIASHGDINFWAVPKCGATSFKFIMAFGEAHPLRVQPRSLAPEDPLLWLHDVELMDYIAPEEALSNGKRNVTVVRHPMVRFWSAYYDLCRRRNMVKVDPNDPHRPTLGMTPEQFASCLVRVWSSGDESRFNPHVRSMGYFLRRFPFDTGEVYQTSSLPTRLNTTDMYRADMAGLSNEGHDLLDRAFTNPRNGISEYQIAAKAEPYTRDHDGA